MQFALNPHQLFILIGLILILAELFVGIEAGFDLVLIGTILIFGGFAGNATSNLTVTLIISAVLAVIYIAYGRSAIKQKITVITHKTNTDKLVGQKGVVVRTITPDTAGMVRIDDEDWRATANAVLYEKDKVKVESISGITLKVLKVKKS